VRGTQLRNQVIDRLWEYGAAEIHLRIGCPPLLFACLTFYQPEQQPNWPRGGPLMRFIYLQNQQALLPKRVLLTGEWLKELPKVWEQLLLSIRV